jgi:hypothetical protein
VVELDELTFARIPCRWRGCGAVFYICLPCYRGQRYCSERCRIKARRAQRREANRRYQVTEQGLKRHRERQRAYRRRRVTDQGSSRTPPALRMGEPAFSPTPAREVRDEPAIADVFVCQCCGRRGRRIDPFASG